jgi:glucan biosynthesis protein
VVTIEAADMYQHRMRTAHRELNELAAQAQQSVFADALLRWASSFYSFDAHVMHQGQSLDIPCDAHIVTNEKMTSVKL